MSETFDTSTESARSDAISAAGEAIKQGQAVVLPTDTVYGIGVDAFSPEAVTLLLAAKGRNREMPPPVLIGRANVMDALAADISEAARKLADAFWPGGLTIILYAQPSLAWDLGETRGTVALRIPADQTALDLLQAVGPMAVSSANRTAMPAATTASEAKSMLADSVAVYLDDGQRNSIEPSTIVDCTQEPPKVVREGSVPLHELRTVVQEVLGIDEDTPAPDSTEDQAVGQSAPEATGSPEQTSETDEK